MKRIKSLVHKYLIKRGFKKLSKTEYKMMQMSVLITEEYIHSRKFRRAIKDTKLANYIEQTLLEWDAIKNTSNE